MQTNSFRKQIRLIIALSIVIYAGSFANLTYAAGPFFYPAPNQGASELFKVTKVNYPFTFIVYGDSREAAGDEKDALIAQIIGEKPSFVLHTGDMVLRGEEHQWKIFDLFDGRIKDRGIPIYPVLGNHEYYARKENDAADVQKQLRPYFKRFKYIKNKRWYSFRYGNSAFLMLDSNADHSPESYQYKWLMNELKKETSGFLFIVLHHPPYTKGKYGLSSKAPKVLSSLLEGHEDKNLTKADIVFSGHAHNYERYKHKEINYVVSGGGGAPQHPISRDPYDFYAKDGETFHYCRIKVSKAEATFEMIRLDENTGKWLVGDTFKISK